MRHVLAAALLFSFVLGACKEEDHAEEYALECNNAYVSLVGQCLDEFVALETAKDELGAYLDGCLPPCDYCPEYTDEEAALASCELSCTTPYDPAQWQTSECVGLPPYNEPLTCAKQRAYVA